MTQAEKQSFKSNFTVGLYSPFLGDFFNLASSDILEFYFIEDIFSYMITGKLVFNDRNGLLEFSSIISGISVQVTYGIDNDVTIVFEVYKTNRVSPMGPNEDGTNNIVELLLVNFGFHELINQRFSRSWNNTKISSIISDIFENMISSSFYDIEIEDESTESIDFVMPYWRPLHAFNWLLKRGSSSNKWGYCLYTTVDSLFTPGGAPQCIVKLKTIESMLQQSELLYDKNDGMYVFSDSDMYNQNRILSHDISGVDLFSNQQLRGGHILGYNYNTKKIIDKEFQYSGGSGSESIYDKFTMLGDWTLFPSSNNTTLDDTSSNITFEGDDSENILKNIFLNNWIKNYCVQNTVSITVMGNEYRKIGNLINIIWPSSYKETEIFNVNLSGTYLIKSVTHYFSPQISTIYQQKLNLVKNAYNFNNIPETLLQKSDKINNLNSNFLGLV